MTNAAESAKARLTQAGRTKDRTRRLSTICIVTTLFLAGWVMVALLDYWLMLPLAPRWAALAGLCALVGGGVWQLRRLWKRPTELKEAALDVEAARPELGCEVSTAAEYLTGERTVQKEYEPELVAALQANAAAAIAQGGTPYQRRLTAPLMIAGGAVFGVLAFLFAVPGAGTALRRTVSPWSRAQFTQVEVLPGSIEVPVGQSLTITNRFSGRVIQSAEIQWREEGRSEWQKAPLQRGTNGLFLFPMGPVQRSFVYRVQGGDATSEDFALTAFVPPAVQRLKLGLMPPGYTKLPFHEQGAADATVIRGTEARFEIQPNIALSKARLRLTNDTFVELQLSTNGTWRGQFAIRHDTDYWIELVDLKGRSGKASKHHLTAIPDEAPKLDIIDPGQDLRAGASDVIPLKVQGTEDFGLQKLRIVFHKLGSPEQELLLTPTFGTNHEFQATAQLALEGLKLSQYDLVVYHAEAVDNNAYDGPGVGKSPMYFVEITNEGGGPKPKSKPKPGEKVNLLTVQKQILSDTASLAASAPKSKYEELAKRQEDAAAFAKMYQDSLMQEGAPVSAQAEMESALKSMELAAAKLGAQQRATALPPEESALASLYQVLKNLPSMAKKLDPPPPKKEDADQKPPPPTVKVVLQAIQKKSAQDPNQPELQEMLTAMKALQQQQAAIAAQCPNPGEGKGASPSAQAPEGSPPKPGSPQSPTPSTAKADRPPGGNPDAKGAPKADEPKDGAPGESKESAPALAQSKPSDAAEPKPGKGAGKSESKSPSEAKAQGKGKGQGKGQGEGQGEGKNDAQANAPGEGQGKGKSKEFRKPGALAKNTEPKSTEPDATKPEANAKPGEGKPGESKAGEPKPPGPRDPAAPKLGEEPSPAALAELAPKQEQVSQEAKELADRMQRLAGKGVRAGHGISRQMSQAAQQLDRAAHAMRQGNAQTASGAGDQGSAAINAAITLLERTLAGKPELSDVASEEAPKQYEGAISDYFKRLSRAE